MAPDNEVVEQISEHLAEIMKLLEIPITDSNKDTNTRVAKMWVNELFANRNNNNIEELDAKMKVFDNEYGNEVIVMKDIEFNSMCFTSKTPIKVKGGTKYIRDIKVGDTILTISDKGEVVEAPVTNVMKRVVNDTLIVHTSNGKHLRCTPNHPFYVLDKGWVNAEDLEPNDSLICLNPLISTTNVLSIEELPLHEVTVYNFEVENYHTYLAGDILVHNCEHHWLPFSGKVTVAYIPNQKVIGLSKIPRVVKYFSKQPTLQEKLGKDIGEYLFKVIQPLGIVVYITSTHSCVKCRGAESDCSTITKYSFWDKSLNVEQYKLFNDIIEKRVGVL